MWQQKNRYYLQNEEWTICKIGIIKKTYELHNEKKKIIIYGFKTAQEAIEKHKEMTK
jgi:hypothetical protein